MVFNMLGLGLLGYPDLAPPKHFSRRTYLSMSGLVELRASMFRMCCSNESWASPRSGELTDPSSAATREHSRGGEGGRIELLRI